MRTATPNQLGTESKDHLTTAVAVAIIEAMTITMLLTILCCQALRGRDRPILAMMDQCQLPFQVNLSSPLKAAVRQNQHQLKLQDSPPSKNTPQKKPATIEDFACYVKFGGDLRQLKCLPQFTNLTKDEYIAALEDIIRAEDDLE